MMKRAKYLNVKAMSKYLGILYIHIWQWKGKIEIINTCILNTKMKINIAAML